MNQQQQTLEFMKFIPVQGEKHLGVAVIRYERRFIFRFKIMPSEHGGYWATTASYKTGVINGKDKYESAFSLDSEYEKELVTSFVLANVEREINQGQSSSVFSQSQQAKSAQPYQQPVAQQQSFFNQSAAISDDNIPF